MDEQRVFEERLAGALRRYVGDDHTEIDARTLARSIIADAPRRRGWRPVGTWQLPRIWLSPAGFIALMLVAFLGATGVAVGGYLLLHAPPVRVPAERGVFAPTGSLSVGREQAAGTTLADGRVLITGGYPPVRMAELWDPATGEFAPAGELAEGRWGHTATLLADGRVLVAGGEGSKADGTTSLLYSAEVWDPATMTFSPTGSTAGGHLHSMARLLGDGRVLLSGGSLLIAGPSAAPEVWDPTTGRFSRGQGLPGADAPAGIPLEGNRVLWLEGSTASVWDPATATSRVVGNLLEPSDGGQSLTLLADGRVLVLGGTQPGGGDRLTSAEIVDPARNSVERTGSLTQGRAGQVAAPLPDGRVLVAGGDAGGGRSAEIFEPP